MKKKLINISTYGMYKVSGIKAIRALTGLGLKEAKDLYERIRDDAGHGTCRERKIVVSVEQLGVYYICCFGDATVGQELGITSIESWYEEDRPVDYSMNGALT